MALKCGLRWWIEPAHLISSSRVKAKVGSSGASDHDRELVLDVDQQLFQIVEDRIQKIDPKTSRMLAIPAPGGGGDSGLTWVEMKRFDEPVRKRAIKLAHSLAQRNVLNVQLKQWMQCMQCEFFSGKLVLVDFKRVGPPSSTT